MAIFLTGTGSCIPARAVPNDAFSAHTFYGANAEGLPQPVGEIIGKFSAITGIRERRYAAADQQTSDLALIAARGALADAGADPESLDGIIVAHNFGDIPQGRVQTDAVPSLATRVKHGLRIRNPACTAFDVLYGCPGWLQGLIIARQFLLGGARRYLVIGAETLSRVVDPFDRDSMIYADGAGASVVESVPGEEGRGILSALSHTYAAEEGYYLHFGESLNKAHTPGTRYIKMQGRKIYEFALNRVPAAMKACLDAAGVTDASEVRKVFLHQANEKMDEAILHRFFQLYGLAAPPGIMPMSIHLLGNSSVATVPTLLDTVRKGLQPGHTLQPGDLVLLASVGAGMNIAAVAYRV